MCVCVCVCVCVQASHPLLTQLQDQVDIPMDSVSCSLQNNLAIFRLSFEDSYSAPIHSRALLYAKRAHSFREEYITNERDVTSGCHRVHAEFPSNDGAAYLNKRTWLETSNIAAPVRAAAGRAAALVSCAPSRPRLARTRLARLARLLMMLLLACVCRFAER